MNNRRLLIVSPHFPPVNAPDMQRVRMSLPYFIKAGWEVTVLAADDREPQAPLEPNLLGTIPKAVRVERVPCLSRRWTSRLGLNNLGWRILPYLYRAGCRVIREWQPDLVYFSTTQFIVLPLGRLWRSRHGTPYVIDMQDPWISNFYDQPGAPRPPGGRKYLLATTTARLLEGWTLKHAAHVVSVSPRYLEDYSRRYRWWTPGRGSVLPFGAPDEDFSVARSLFSNTPPILPPSGNLRIAYAGCLGAVMLPALELLCAAIATWKDSPRCVELHFFGTSYAPPELAQPTTPEVAARHGVAHLVHEQPARIGYLDSLRLLLETDVALVLGSTDASYSPSKLYPTMAAGKPTIALAPVGSVLADNIAKTGGVALISFRGDLSTDNDALNRLSDMLSLCLAGKARELCPPIDAKSLLDRHGATAVARRQIEIFSTIVSA